MAGIEQRKNCTVKNVRLICSIDNSEYIEDINFIQWNNNGTVGNLADDTFEYKYICPTCSDIVLTKIKYPYQEFTEI